MAIMSRGKKANARGWDTINKQREEENKSQKDKEKTEISEEEHKEKLKILEGIGLLKKEN